MANPFFETADAFLRMQGNELRRLERRALKIAGNVLLESARTNCPVKTGHGGLLKDGELQDSLKVHVHTASDADVLQGISSRAVVAPSGKDPYTVAGWVVNGHMGPRPEEVPKGHRKAWDRENGNKFIPGNPFMDRSWDEAHEAAENAFADSMIRDLQKENF